MHGETMKNMRYSLFWGVLQRLSVIT